MKFYNENIFIILHLEKKGVTNELEYSQSNYRIQSISLIKENDEHSNLQVWEIYYMCLGNLTP